MIKIKEIESFKDYGRVLSISNEKVEVKVTLDLGPRVISYGYVGGKNFLCAERKALGGVGDEEYSAFFGEGRKWESFGGHRIWITPECYPDTYTPDDKPVKYTLTDSGAIFTPPAEEKLGIQKELEVKLDSESTDLQVEMRVTNLSDKPREFAIWAITVCDKGGVLVVPMNTDDTGYLQNREISLWAYTDMRDNRIYWGNKYTTVTQDENRPDPFKLGFNSKKGVAYYINGNEILCKKFETDHFNKVYPDGGCSLETYTNDIMLEFETLGEVKTVKANETSSYKENWSLIKTDFKADFTNDDSIDELLSKI